MKRKRTQSTLHDFPKKVPRTVTETIPVKNKDYPDSSEVSQCDTSNDQPPQGCYNALNPWKALEITIFSLFNFTYSENHSVFF